MQITDLTHIINDKMTVFPGSTGPSVENTSIIETNGYAEKRITLFTHTGTHMDAPGHILKDGKCLDDFPVSKFYGRGLILDCSYLAGMEITLDFLEPFSEKINMAEFLLLNSGWYKKWESSSYFYDFPTLSPDASRWLTNFHLKAIGLDSISLDKIDSKDLPNHHIVLSSEMLIVENLTNLDELNGRGFIFQCFPLKIEKADGSPVRAIAIYT